jgi:hypothetical protein
MAAILERVRQAQEGRRDVRSRASGVTARPRTISQARRLTLWAARR